MPEQEDLQYYNQQLEYGMQLVDYDKRRRNAKKFLDEGKLTEDKYNDYLMKFNYEERLQNTRIDNYKQAVNQYSDEDKINFNFYHLLMNGDWDNAAKFYSHGDNKRVFYPNAPMYTPQGNSDSTFYPEMFGVVVNQYNDFFRKDGEIQNSKTVEINEWYFDALEKYSNNNSINLSDYGIAVDKSSRSITIPHDEKAFMILSKSINSITREYPFRTIFHNVGDGGHLNTAGDALNHLESRYNNMKSKYPNPVLDDMPIHSSLDYIDTFAFVENGQIKTANGIGSFQEMQNYMDRVALGTKAGETKYNNEEIYNTFYNQLVGTKPANIPFWTLNGNEFNRDKTDNTGEFEVNTNDKHHNQIKEDIAYAMQKQKDGVMIRPVSDGENYGHVIYIPARENSDGSKQVHPGYSVFIPYFFEREAIDKYRNDLGVYSKDEIKTMEGYALPNNNRSVSFQGANCQGSYRVTKDFNDNYRYYYKNSNEKEFDLVALFGNPEKAKAALWQIVTAQHKLNDYTNIGVITEDWFDGLMQEYNATIGMKTQDILSILGEQDVNTTRRNIRTAYSAKFQQ